VDTLHVPLDGFVLLRSEGQTVPGAKPPSYELMIVKYGE